MWNSSRRISRPYLFLFLIPLLYPLITRAEAVLTDEQVRTLRLIANEGIVGTQTLENAIENSSGALQAELKMAGALLPARFQQGDEPLGEASEILAEKALEVFETTGFRYLATYLGLVEVLLKIQIAVQNPSAYDMDSLKAIRKRVREIVIKIGERRNEQESPFLEAWCKAAVAAETALP